ncbi:MAG: hypothetical protein PGN34_06185 [Methylobacterium frigidaeris]
MSRSGPNWLHLVDEAGAASPLPGAAGRQRLLALRGQLRNQLVLMQKAVPALDDATRDAFPDAAAALDELRDEVERLADAWDRLATLMSENEG